MKMAINKIPHDMQINGINEMEITLFSPNSLQKTLQLEYHFFQIKINKILK